MRLMAPAAWALAVTISQPGVAQDAATLARHFAEMPEVQVMFDDMFAPEMLARRFLLELPAEVALSDDQVARVGGVMAEMMTSLRPEFTRMMIDGMADTFNAAEIEALIAFYGSPEGASAMRKMQLFMNLIMLALTPLVQAGQLEYLPDLITIIEE